MVYYRGTQDFCTADRSSSDFIHKVTVGVVAARRVFDSFIDVGVVERRPGGAVRLLAVVERELVYLFDGLYDWLLVEERVKKEVG